MKSVYGLHRAIYKAFARAGKRHVQKVAYTLPERTVKRARHRAAQDLVHKAIKCGLLRGLSQQQVRQRIHQERGF